MTAQILDGKALAATIKTELTQRVAALAERGITPGLGTVLVGDDPGSVAYVRGKHRDCAEVGIESIRVDLPGDATEAEVHEAIARLNADPAVTGYIVQLPLPAGMDENAALELIDPGKDADGLHPTNLGRLVLVRDVDQRDVAAGGDRVAQPRHDAGRVVGVRDEVQDAEQEHGDRHDRGGGQRAQELEHRGTRDTRCVGLAQLRFQRCQLIYHIYFFYSENDSQFF